MNTDVSRAEQRRREREWLRFEYDDAARTAAFDAAKQGLSAAQTAHADALIAVGEFAALPALLADISEPAVFLEVFARYFAASGNDNIARGLWPRVLDSSGGGRGRGDSRLGRATVDGLVMAAEAIGDRATAAELTALARTLPAADTAGLSGKSAAPSAGADSGLARPFDTITNAVYGTLGYAPDAARGRLLLRPVIDPGWRRWTVRNIHIGDALVDVVYHDTGDNLSFDIVQHAGAFPVRLVLEASLAVAVGAAAVDDQPAVLDFRPDGERIIVPVQIVLDEQRRVMMTKNPPS